MDARKARTAGQPGETADDFRASPDAPIFVIENFGRGTIRVGQARDRMDGVSSLIRQLALAIKLLLVSRHGGSMLIPGSSQASLICCWLNYLFLQNRRRIVLYNIFP